MWMNTDWAELLTSSTGRLARGPFLLVTALLVAAVAVYDAVGGTLHLFTGWFVYPALLYVGACVLSKRLHDRGRSGWWAALILVAFVAAWPYPSSFVDSLFCVVLFWAVIELGVMPGEQGANRFGPNPLKSQVA
ncbi:DUF805 domain-containing protein [Caulobacter sp. 73W]|uniref:DUF805 domain-containing protein n=1 Tax=Caulobacter sp. 73W TaxID=3161137 RepID=A0AB39KTY3_9CAUL